MNKYLSHGLVAVGSFVGGAIVGWAACDMHRDTQAQQASGSKTTPAGKTQPAGG